MSRRAVANGGFISGSVGQEVDIPGRPQCLAGPHAEERRALQGESVHLVRGGEAVEEALDGVALEHALEVGPLPAGKVQEALADGRGYVPDRRSARVILSAHRVPGRRATLARHTSAARHIWSTLALRSRRASRSASSRDVLANQPAEAEAVHDGAGRARDAGGYPLEGRVHDAVAQRRRRRSAPPGPAVRAGGACGPCAEWRSRPRAGAGCRARARSGQSAGTRRRSGPARRRRPGYSAR